MVLNLTRAKQAGISVASMQFTFCFMSANYIYMYIYYSKRTWRDDELSGIKRKSNSTSALPSKKLVTSEYSK